MFAWFINWFESMELVEQIYACIGIVGAVLLFFETILLILGAAHSGPDFGGHDVDLGGHAGDAHFGGGHSGDFGSHMGGTHLGDTNLSDGHLGDFGSHMGDTPMGDAHLGNTQLGDAYFGDSHAGNIDGHFGDIQGDLHGDLGGHIPVEVLHPGALPGDIYIDTIHMTHSLPQDAGIDDSHLPQDNVYHDLADKTHGTGLRLFTMQGIIAFACIFGWTGLIFIHAGLPIIVASFLAFICGFAAMFLMALAMWGMLKLQDDGTMDIRYALRKSGETYLPIPASRERSGKIMVTVQEQITEFDAVTDDKQLIPTGASVTVIGITRGNTLIVTKQ
ncbi:MAG TPA: hypothetical protein PK567_01030 [Bacillota bacterium]|nr:hypothetical protein [Bacillota bacterium]